MFKVRYVFLLEVLSVLFLYLPYFNYVWSFILFVFAVIIGRFDKGGRPDELIMSVISLSILTLTKISIDVEQFGVILEGSRIIG